MGTSDPTHPLRKDPHGSRLRHLRRHLRGRRPQERQARARRLLGSGAARAAPAPVLDEIARDHDEVSIVKLNTDENPAITGQLGITSIPTMHVYQNGEIVKTIIGAMPKPKPSASEPLLG